MNLKFWNRRNDGGAAVMEPQAEPLTKAPVSVPDDDQEFVREYERVAAKLGVVARPNNHLPQLARVLSELGITVFDGAKIASYMESRRLRADKDERTSGSHWQLQSLCMTERHKQENTAAISEYTTTRGMHPGIPVAYPRLHSAYAQPIPLPVLLTVEKIEDALPGQCEFVVHSLKADPFLSVHLVADPERKGFFIERWDEPSFRG